MITDTIAAISTPHGRGGIAVIRISGENALEVSDKIFAPLSKKKLSSYESNRAVYGHIYSGGNRIDDGIALIFRAPHSYTGEDTVEISCHGGILISQLVLEAALTNGAVMAGPGEFTRRAFAAGKLSLTQAEAVSGLIDACSREQVLLNAALAGGTLSKKVSELRNEILSLLASVYVYIDFPDEDMTDIPPDELRTRIEGIIKKLSALEDSYQTGRAVSEGILTVIAGQPNTGKSSLLNLLLSRDRAIVTSEAGTTRDVIEENLMLGRVMFRLCDTAGIRETENEAEKIGVGKSEALLNDASLILAVFDGSTDPDSDTLALAERISQNRCPVIAIINKTDLNISEGINKIKDMFDKVVYISCRSENGLDELKELMLSLFDMGDIDYNNEAIIVNSRQLSAVKNAREALIQAVAVLNSSYTQDVAGFDLEQALTELSGLDGQSTAEEIVDAIFHNFCVGK